MSVGASRCTSLAAVSATLTNGLLTTGVFTIHIFDGIPPGSSASPLFIQAEPTCVDRKPNPSAKQQDKRRPPKETFLCLPGGEDLAGHPRHPPIRRVTSQGPKVP